MSNFDKWFKDYHSNNEAYAEQLTKDAFEAGAASRQAEIDALQKRIDDALSWLSAIDTPNEAYQSIDNLMKILKGESK